MADAAESDLDVHVMRAGRAALERKRQQRRLGDFRGLAEGSSHGKLRIKDGAASCRMPLNGGQTRRSAKRRLVGARLARDRRCPRACRSRKARSYSKQRAPSARSRLMRVASAAVPQTISPAAWADDHAHWKLKPPNQPTGRAPWRERGGQN